MDNQNQPNQRPQPVLPPTQNLPNHAEAIHPLPHHVLSNQAEPSHPLSKAEKFKRVYFQVLITCLVGAAAVAVIAVLVGSFNDTLGRALGTIAMVALHAALSFSYITETDKKNKKDGGRSIDLFNNTVFALIVISFITSVFAIWQFLDGELTLKLYMSYGVLLFATLHADVLYRIRRFEKRIDAIVSTNYIFMATVVAMLFAVIFSGSPSDLGEFYYRLLAAVGIIDATLTITAIIMHKMYLQKHPVLSAHGEQANSAQSKNFWKNPLVILLIIFLAFQVIGTMVALLINGF
jgi:lysylphosphatidylglycerol synthetase-like protein (DUF2156 family)